MALIAPPAIRKRPGAELVLGVVYDAELTQALQARAFAYMKLTVTPI